MTSTPRLRAKNLKVRLTKLGDFTPVFETEGFKFAEMRGGDEIEAGVYEMPWCHVSDAAKEFVDTCYTDGWVLSEFDWPKWGRTSEAAELLNDANDPSPASALMNAIPEQLTKLITAVVRADRLCEGYLNGAFESGLLVGVVQRARQLAGSN